MLILEDGPLIFEGVLSQSGCGQWRGRGLLATIATSGASHSADEEHPHLL
jgi:hypothetical protein